MHCNDTDSVKYKIQGLHEKVFLYMICIDADKIWNHSHKYFLNKYYPCKFFPNLEFKVSLAEFKS